MIRRLGLLRWLLYLALPLLVIYFTLNVMLTSTVFSRFVLDRLEAVAPELQFTQVEGNFIRGLSLNFRYTGADQDVQAQGLTLQLGLECLWQLKLCIRSLHIDQLRLALSPSEEARPESESGLELPEVELPLEIELRSLLIGRLQLVEDEKTLYELTDLDAALRWQGSTLFVERLALADEWCRWAGEGEIKLTEHYPVDVALACASLQGFGSASAQIDGDLQQLQVALNARVTSVYSAEAANIRAAVSMALTDAELPFTAQVQLDPVRLAVDDMLIQLQASELALHGPLLSPAIQGVLNFESPFWAGENKLTLDAKASTEALRINSLLLQLPEGEMTVEGLLDYSEALSWQGQVSWQNIALEQFAEGFNGRLHGSVDSAADYRDDKLRAELNLSAVGGTLLDRSFAAAGKLRYDDQVLEVVDLDLRQGENHLQLAGELAFEQASNLRLRLKLPQLRQLIPEQWLEQFEGAVEGELHLTGSIEQPALEAGLRVQNLSYDDISLQEGTLQLNWQGADEPDVNFSLVLDRLGLGEDLLAQLNLSGRGRQSAHQLSLEARGLAQHQDKRLLLHCEGGFPRTLLDTWRGQCDRLDVDFALSEPQQWRLREPVTFVISPGAPAVELSAFCLVYQNASLCSEQSVQYRNNSLSPITVGGNNFAADWFQGFVPTQELQLAGSWGVRFSAMDIVGGEPQLSASLFSTDLAAIWNDAQGPLRLQAENLSLTWTLAQQRHRINWALDTTDNGTSRGNLSLAGEAIDGRVIISGIELADYGQLFLPMEDDELAGQLNADLAVSGTLAQPSLNGRVDLEGGRFRSDMLPVALEDIQLQLAIRDNIASINGHYRAADSQGSLGGEFKWEGLDWSGHMSMAAEPLLVRPEPKMQIYVAPDLRFDFAPSRIAISGRVAIPRAELEFTELPEQAVSVSSDTVIVGAGDNMEGAPLQVLVNVELQLGDRVVFDGFGLETNITGNLRLQQRSGEMLRANGRLSLVEGRYNAYGQHLVIRSGDLVFVGDIDNPQLRVEAVRSDTPENITVGLRASGPAHNPRVSLFSQPDMPQQAQLSYLITGNPPGSNSELDPQQAAAEAALSYALESGIGSGITRRAGDVLGIEDLQLTAGSTGAGTQIGLSGHLTSRLLVRYGVGVFDAINTWTLRYQVSRSVYLEAISGEASDIGIMWSFERN